MKIVDRKTFMALPPETMYSKYVPSVFEGLCIKGDTIYASDGKPIDWFFQQVGADSIDAHDCGEWGDLLAESEQTGRELVLDFECQGRDGCFEDDQLFAVFSKQDAAQLVERLKRCL